MSGIIFYFEDYDSDVWSGRPLDLDAWKYNVSASSSIDKVIIINKTEETLMWSQGGIDIQIVSEIPELDGHVTQLVTPSEMVTYGKESTSLWDFNHETDWYVFGPASGWGGNYFGDTLLSIPHNKNTHHHSVFIASITLYHRYSVIGDTQEDSGGIYII